MNTNKIAHSSTLKTGVTGLAALVLAFALVGALAGCSASSSSSSSSSKSSSASSASASTASVASAADFESQLGLTMPLPADIQNATYSIVDGTTAVAQYTWNGSTYEERMQKSTEEKDISGVSNSWQNTSSYYSSVLSYTMAYNNGNAGVIRWSSKTDDGSVLNYSISMTTGASDTALTGAVEAATGLATSWKSDSEKDE